LEEPVPETKKVQDFLTSILNPKLQVGKDIILATPQYLVQDFEECQQYLSTLVSNSTAQAKNDHAVGSATHGDEDNLDGRGPPKKKKKLEKGKVKRPLTARSYSNTEWYSLKDPEWKEVMDIHAKKPGKGRGKPKEKDTRSNSSVTSAKETADAPDKEEEDNLDDTPKQKNSARYKFGC
jgi:hypothetical protein